MIVKTTCLQKDYDVSFAPNDGGIMNEVGIDFSGLSSQICSEQIMKLI